MEYNFDKFWDRSGRDATKWDSPRKPQCQVYTEVESFVPMWIADMDFATPDFVVEAMKERMEHPIFGYFATPKRYFDAIRFWQRERYGVLYEIENENIMYQNSVLGGVASFISAHPPSRFHFHIPRSRCSSTGYWFHCNGWTWRRRRFYSSSAGHRSERRPPQARPR